MYIYTYVLFCFVLFLFNLSNRDGEMYERGKRCSCKPLVALVKYMQNVRLFLLKTVYCDACFCWVVLQFNVIFYIIILTIHIGIYVLF